MKACYILTCLGVPSQHSIFYHLCLWKCVSHCWHCYKTHSTESVIDLFHVSNLSHTKTLWTSPILTISSIHTHFNTLTKKIFRKTLWKKGSNFNFFYNVFYAICILKTFTLFPNKPWFLHLSSTSVLKILWEKECKLHVMSNFSFSHSVF